MNNSLVLMLALATVGLMLAMPAQAADDLPEGALLLARAETKDASPGKENRRAARRQDDSERAYGYGYERRQRSERPDNAGGRDRPESSAARSERTERGDRGDRNSRGGERSARRDRD